MRRWCFERIHVSWHIAWLSAGVVAGIAMGRDVSASKGLLFLAGATLMCVTLFLRWRFLCIMALCAGCLCGLGRADMMHRQTVPLERYTGRIVELRAVVREDPALGSHGERNLQVTATQIADKEITGLIWISTSSRAEILRGDFVIVKGQLRSGFGSFAGSMSQAQVVAVIRPYPGDIARRVRDWFANGIRRAIDEPQAALGIGYLTGQQTALPPELNDQLRAVGLTHAVVASGYNLTILVGFARSVFLKVSKYLAALCAAGMVLVFMAVTGLSPSMTRAGLVTIIGLAVWYYGRSVHPVILLLVAAALTAVYNPAFVWGDLGWYLSFAAFAGVLILSPLAVHYFWGDEPPSAFWSLVVETVSAQIITLPIILFAFGVAAMYALPANILIVPLIPAAMLLVFLAGIAGVAVPSTAALAGMPAEALLKYMTGVIQYIASLPGAVSDVRLSGIGLLLYYAALGTVMFWMYRRTKHDFIE